jgi:phosphoribosylformylglycinamidine synthase subunit PurQ / glutaminase
MATPKALVLRAAGVNCDVETQYALEQAGFEAQRIHVFRLIEDPTPLREAQFLVIAGGFSYGDDVAAGKILANQLLRHLAAGLNEFIAAEKLILGICNGFQVMIKSGLLPEGDVDPQRAHQQATLGWNDSGRFEDLWVFLRADSDKCVFLPKGETVRLPIAHGEGKFVPRDEQVLDQLREQDQIAVRYVDAEGRTGQGYPVNPNASVDDVAGLCDASGRIMGVMPHPERFLEITNHPQWTRGGVRRADGRLFFENARKYFD